MAAAFAIVLLALVGHIATGRVAWPPVATVRAVVDQGYADMDGKLKPHIPAGVSRRLDERYGEAERRTLDVFLPPPSADATRRPAVVWVHGGGWIAGDKSLIRNYLQALSGTSGLAVVAVNFSLAPEAGYPAPVADVNAALAWLVANHERFGIDPGRLFLAGDTSGAQIAAQVANLVGSESYARQLNMTPAIGPDALRGLVLFSGVYEIDETLDTEHGIGGFLDTMLWSYLGSRDYREGRVADEFSIVRNMGKGFPLFISAGNADPLAPQSYELADVASALEAPVESFFFAADERKRYENYQFNLDDDLGGDVFWRVCVFLQRMSGPAQNPAPPPPAASPAVDEVLETSSVATPAGTGDAFRFAAEPPLRLGQD